MHSFRPATLTRAHGGSMAGTSAGSASAKGDPAPVTAPGVVVIHGTLVTDALYRPFARNLSLLLSRPVHCYNRRGRAGSAPQPDGYSVTTEIGDLAAVMKATGSEDVVAHSFGGFVALQAARNMPLRRLVTYDAAVSLSGNLDHRWRPELEQAVTEGQLNHAWAHLVQGLATAGPLSYLPLGALRMLSIMSARTNVGAEMRELLPTAVKEMRAVLDADAELADYMELTTPTLMLSGGWSPGYFADTGRQLASAVPAIDFAVVPGQLHEGPIRPGKRLAIRMARFLNGTDGTVRPLSRKRRRR
ncbi:putative hydrolase [Arthrobacter globiformis NBRC 12137]|uniref:Putative hydrolase n=1 Tax=Arthrobacter globiformis (strain ATCC 8010 / DSM 20124 / JCM 1332 / NBRC 12137 / NCIMB 8907 / NRRL B-2979 / 168) TaxID=1077972 RepID=H0QJJ9_ARTG1|nr:putative hydrolase [Arthrobacter globiformis NBRC 12137]